MRVAQKICILGAISLNKIFIKFVAIQKSPDFFVTPYFSWKNSVTPSFFMAPYSEENDSP